MNFSVEPGNIGLLFGQTQLALEIHPQSLRSRAEAGVVAGITATDGNLDTAGAELMAVFQKFNRVLESRFRFAFVGCLPVQVVRVGADAEALPLCTFGAQK